MIKFHLNNIVKIFCINGELLYLNELNELSDLNFSSLDLFSKSLDGPFIFLVQCVMKFVYL